MKYSSIQRFFNKSCELKYYDTINNFKDYFFQGFEWFDTIESIRVDDLNLLTYQEEDIKLEPFTFDDERAVNVYSMISSRKIISYKIKFFFKVKSKNMAKNILKK